MPLIGTLTLTEFSDGENRRTWSLAGHTTMKPKLVIQSRKVPSSSDLTAYSTSNLKVVFGTEDAAGAPMAQKISFDVQVRYPVGVLATDLASAVDAFQELVAATEFDTLVNTQAYLG